MADAPAQTAKGGFWKVSTNSGDPVIAGAEVLAWLRARGPEQNGRHRTLIRMFARPSSNGHSLVGYSIGYHGRHTHTVRATLEQTFSFGINQSGQQQGPDGTGAGPMDADIGEALLVVLYHCIEKMERSVRHTVCEYNYCHSGN